jgi:hypothetical protein
MIGGVAEANHFRRFAAHKLGAAPAAADAPPGGGPPAHLPPARVLFVDRGGPPPPLPAPAPAPAPPRPPRTFERYFANRGAMLGVLAKYGLAPTLLTDADIGAMSLAQQARAWAAHGLLVIVHGATEVNNAFLPPRAAVIEVSPFLTWCPLYANAAHRAGLHHLPIYARAKPPTLEYAWTYTFPGQTPAQFDALVAAFAARCDDKGLVRASADAECWHEALRTSVVTPIHTFEHTLLTALELVGLQRPHNASAIDRLHGVPEGRPPALVDDAWYEQRAWAVCPPHMREAAAAAEHAAAAEQRAEQRERDAQFERAKMNLTDKWPPGADRR